MTKYRQCKSAGYYKGKIVLKAALAALTILVMFKGVSVASPGISIAVIDLKKVQTKSKAMDSLKAQADKLRQLYQEEVAKDEDQLRKESMPSVKAYQSKDGVPNLEERLEKKYRNLYKLARTRKYQWENAVHKANAQFTQKVSEIVDRIANSKQFTVVISKDALMFSRGEVDITDEVVTVLNKELPNIKVAPVAEEEN